MREQFLWVEKYRPKTIEDCILPDSLKATFQEFVNKKEIPNLLLSGTAGVGKTTVAKALCEEVGCDYLVINGSDEGRMIDNFRTTVKSYASTMSFGGGRKVVIVDEADYMNAESVQPLLRNMMEELSNNCSFIFTCNFKNRIIEPLHSRCTVIDFKLNGSKAKMAAAFFKRVEWILGQEGVEYEKEVVASIITKHFPDNRRILNELQRYASSGKIDKGILSAVAEVQLGDLIKALKNKDFTNVRKWVSMNLDNDPTRVYRKFYESFYEELQPQSVPQLVLHLAKYQYQAAFVADQEVNMIACLTEIMVDCDFK